MAGGCARKGTPQPTGRSSPGAPGERQLLSCAHTTAAGGTDTVSDESGCHLEPAELHMTAQALTLKGRASGMLPARNDHFQRVSRGCYRGARACAHVGHREHPGGSCSMQTYLARNEHVWAGSLRHAIRVRTVRARTVLNGCASRSTVMETPPSVRHHHGQVAHPCFVCHQRAGAIRGRQGPRRRAATRGPASTWHEPSTPSCPRKREWHGWPACTAPHRADQRARTPCRRSGWIREPHRPIHRPGHAPSRQPRRPGSGGRRPLGWRSPSPTPR